MAQSSDGLEAALRLLIGKHERPTSLVTEQKSITIRELLTAGVTKANLRLLQQNGYVEVVGGDGRLKVAGLDSARVRLTPAGAALAGQLLAPFPKKRKRRPGFPDFNLPATPTWDRQTGLLMWGHFVFENFRKPAPNLEALLNALVKHDWPPWTPNPFHPTTKHSSKYLEREAMKNWNYSHLGKFIYLHGDGAGTGFFWERMV
jgi:hypothetical protein